MVEKKFKGWLKDERGTIGKKFSRNMYIWVQNDCFDESVLDGLKQFEA